MLSIAVFFAVQATFPAKKSTPGVVADSTAKKSVAGDSLARSQANGALAGSTSVSGNTAGGTSTGATPAVASVTPETTVVSVRRDSGATFAVSNIGAAPVSAVMNAYANRARPGRVDLAANRPLIKYQLVTNKKTPIDLNTVAFTVTRHGTDTLVYQAPVTDGGVSGTVTLQYVFGPDGHVMHVQGATSGIDAGYLIVNLPETFNVVEKDSSSDLRAFAYSYDSKRDGTRSVLFSSLDPGEKKLVEGPITWVAAKSKYFVVGLLSGKNGRPFDEMDLTGGARLSKVATQAQAAVVVPIASGQFGFDLYAGPQEWRRLHALGQDFDQVNPYGWAIFRGLLQPIATSVIRLVLWMHREMQLSYGWVLIVLGVLIRLILWPLNQGAMRTSLKMQRLQPELQAVQERYKNDREKQQQAMMQVYKDHNMNPLSPLTGCLPMFLPMPILLALFFVFQNTIEFRGVPFWWMSDLSAHDPYYILPVVMAISMYVLSWLGMRNSPSNPQAKMMSYMMPGMFLLFLGRAAAGLNLYYAAQNLAALPQQWLLIRERSKPQEASPKPTKSPKKG
jgi:YidC/Oxa1 family membrane protein insertase